MQQNNHRFENSMNIHLLSFKLPKDVVKDKEEIRVSITTIPEENKEHFSIEGKNMNKVNHVFSMNITNETKKVIMVFRKKTVFGEKPIIASTTIKLNEFENIPREEITNGVINTDVKTIDIYYPLQQQKKEEHKEKVERKILGQMQVQLSFSSPYFNRKQDKINKINKINVISKNNKINQKKKTNMKNGYEQLSDENDLCNSFLL